VIALKAPLVYVAVVLNHISSHFLIPLSDSSIMWHL